MKKLDVMGIITIRDSFKASKTLTDKVNILMTAFDNKETEYRMLLDNYYRLCEPSENTDYNVIKKEVNQIFKNVTSEVIK